MKLYCVVIYVTSSYLYMADPTRGVAKGEATGAKASPWGQ